MADTRTKDITFSDHQKTESYEKTNFIFVERYKDQSPVDAHFATPYFSEYGNKIAGMTSDPMEIKKYDIAGEQ